MQRRASHLPPSFFPPPPPFLPPSLSLLAGLDFWEPLIESRDTLGGFLLLPAPFLWVIFYFLLPTCLGVLSDKWAWEQSESIVFFFSFSFFISNVRSRRRADISETFHTELVRPLLKAYCLNSAHFPVFLFISRSQWVISPYQEFST